MRTTPPAQGLYDPRFEHENCGVAFVVDMHGRRTHQLVEQGITALVHLDHRGASGAETNTGDGAGILIQVPDAFYRDVLDVELPAAGAYATGIGFFPGDDAEVASAVEAVDKIVASEGLEVLAWRDVPVDASSLGSGALSAMPTFRQLFLAAPGGAAEGLDLERRVYVVRKRIEHEIGEGEHEVSLAEGEGGTWYALHRGRQTAVSLFDPFSVDLDAADSPLVQ